MPRPERETLTVPDAAARIGIHPQTLRKWIRDGKTPFFCIGETYVIGRDAMERFLSGDWQPQPPASVTPVAFISRKAS